MHIDILGHPIEKGMTVLTNSYCSASMTDISKVDRVTAKAIYVTVNAWSYDAKSNLYVEAPKAMRKRADQVIVVSRQLEYNKKHYPEHML